MPSKSKAQQKFMGAVYALKKGDINPSDVTPAVRKVAKDMKKSDAKDFASTKHKGLPKKVKQEIIKRLKQEGEIHMPQVGSYAIPSKLKKRKHKDTDNLGKRNKNGNAGQPDLEEAIKPDFNSKGYKEADKLVSKLRSSIFKKLNDDELEQFRAKIAREFDLKENVNEGSFQLGTKAKPPLKRQGLNHHILTKSKPRRKYHDDDANFKKKDSGQEDLDEKNLNELGIFPISNYIKGMIPSKMLNTVNRNNKEKFDAVIDDLIRTLNHFWKKNNIPYRVRKK